MLRWTSVLLLVGPAILLFYALRRGRDRQRVASQRDVILIYAISAAAPLLFALLWRWDATRVAIELHGIAFRGNDVIRRDVTERRQGSGQITIDRRKSQQPRFGTLVFRGGSLTIDIPRPSQRAGVIAARSGILGALPVEDGDRICIASTCLTVPPIPRRSAQIPGFGWTFPLPFARPATAPLRTWSLDWLAHEHKAVDPDRRLRSFLAYTRPGARLHLVALDDDVTLQRGGGVVQAPANFKIEDRERIAFYTLPNQSAAFAAPGITERRSMIVRTGDRSFALDLDTPETHSLTVAELRLLEVARQKEASTMRIPLSMGDAQLVDRSLYFSGLSEPVAVEANALFELARSFPRNFSSTFPIVSPRGPVTGTLGKVQWLGTSDLAAVRLDVLRPPLLLLLIGLGLLALKIIAAIAARLTMTQLLIAGAIELLAGFRLLIGYRAWSMPPHRIEAAELAALAWMSLPWMFLVWTAVASATAFTDPKRRLTSPHSMPALAGLFLSAVFAFQVVEGPTRWVWLLAHLLPLAALLPVDRVTAQLRNRVTLKFDPILAAAIAFTIIRLALLFFGFKESIVLGARFSLSVIHIPAAVILEGIFLWKYRDMRRFLAILFFVWLIPAAITSDIGLALLNVPPFVFAYYALTRRARLIMIAVVLFIAGAPLLRIALPFISSEQFLLKAASEANYARFLHFAAPERLRDLATKRGESLAITSAILQSYIDSGWFGRGYGRSDVTSHLGDTALRDFAPAVFIAAEWGLIGTVAALMLYLLFTVLARSWLSGGQALLPVQTAAFMAAATITFSSIYMILANHELLLLTGKNAYLLGLDSAGDVMEFLVLMLIIAAGAAAARGEDRAFGGGLA